MPVADTSQLAPWLERVYQRIKLSSEQEHLPHAILLDSLPGWGVLELAERVCELILNEEVHFDQDRNLNLLQIQVKVEKEKRRQFISIDQVREAIEFLMSTTLDGSRKVVVIKWVEQLSIPASQALLKVLEEPPSDKHLLLVTNNSSSLMPTIKSRCQHFVVSPGSESEVSEFMSQRNLVEEQSKSYLNDFGEAPYAVLNAIETQRISVREILAEMTQGRVSVVAASREFSKHEDVDDILRSWQYITLKFAQNSRNVSPVAVFYDHLCDMRRQFSEVPGLNAERQFQRLCIKWLDLYGTMRQSLQRRS